MRQKCCQQDEWCIFFAPKIHYLPTTDFLVLFVGDSCAALFTGSNNPSPEKHSSSLSPWTLCALSLSSGMTAEKWSETCVECLYRRILSGCRAAEFRLTKICKALLQRSGSWANVCLLTIESFYLRICCWSLPVSAVDVAIQKNCI